MERFRTSAKDGRCSAPAEVLTRHPLQGGVCKRRDCVWERVAPQALALNQWVERYETLAYVNSLT